MHLKSVLIIS